MWKEIDENSNFSCEKKKKKLQQQQQNCEQETKTKMELNSYMLNFKAIITMWWQKTLVEWVIVPFKNENSPCSQHAFGKQENSIVLIHCFVPLQCPWVDFLSEVCFNWNNKTIVAMPGGPFLVSVVSFVLSNSRPVKCFCIVTVFPKSLQQTDTVWEKICQLSICTWWSGT